MLGARQYLKKIFNFLYQAKLFKSMDLPAFAMHSRLSQSARTKITEQFRSGTPVHNVQTLRRHSYFAL